MQNNELDALAQKEIDRQEQFDSRIYCCTSTACLSAGARHTLDALQAAVKTCDCKDKNAEVVKTGCMGLCSRGPLVRVETKGEEPALYGDVTAHVAEQIVARHLQCSIPDSVEAPHHRIPLDIPFFAKQEKVVLNECGRINPEKLEDYLAHGGFSALRKVLSEMTPKDVCDEILRSGLRGRGGAGFPTGMKWEFTRRETSDVKYVIVNGDEGDPGAYMDRTVMEDDPYRVIEGMIICAYATGATHGYIYIRGEYPTAVLRIGRALRTALRHGILGDNIFGTDFSFTAEVRIGAGAFVCGEETALIHSVEGQRGVPRMRPPYPSTAGLWGKPTVINNVEAMGNVPTIIRRGADWFAGIGTEKSKGTKVFALAGQLRNTGLIEVPMGTTLREIVFEIGGGIPGDRAFKAAQTGGPSGGCIPEEFLDQPVDYENIKRLGSIMGSGGLVVIDDTTRMPDFARFFIDFCVDESCGKCLPCRVGTVQIRNLLDKLISGEGQAADIDKLESLCKVVQKTSLCGLGQSAPNPVLSTLKYFRHEYEALLPQAAGDNIG
jgi:bidirectional [NiFe] hydrogenase diaphorase subunit